MIDLIESNVVKENAVDAPIKQQSLYLFSFAATKGEESGYASHIFNVEDGKITQQVLNDVIQEAIKKMELSTCTILNWKKIEE